MTGHSTRLLDGVARLLDVEGVGTYRTSGAYADDETAIVFGLLPGSPAAAVALNTYTVEDEPTEPTGITGLQVRMRGAGRDPRPVFDQADAVFELLQGAYLLELPNGAVIGQSWRNSSAPLGTDEQGRYEIADSYYCRIDRTTRHRT